MGSSAKKHKKHKRERLDDEQYLTAEKPPTLKLILKVPGNSGTPEHGSESPNPMHSQQYQQQLGLNYSVNQGDAEYDKYVGHKKLKKKKKKKDKRHKHHHKDKKRKREESSQESVGDNEESVEPPKKYANNSQLLPPQRTPVISEKTIPTSVTSSLSPHREPRTCVLRKIAEKSPLQRLLEHLLRSMERRDPQQFFAWPVTDNIAPGYSQIITNPMDFSTIKQKIDENSYISLNDFVDDFKLMCNNAMTYNQSDTIYFKAAKKLLHVGLKMVVPEKLRQLRPVLAYMHEITKDELGFELGVEDPNNPDVLVTEEQIEKEREQEERNEEAEELRKEANRKIRLASLGKFEAIPDDLTPEEILKQARGAAQQAAEKLSMKRVGSKMGFLRQKKDGTTSLQILVPNDGIIPGTNQRPVSLGQLIGKLTHGTGVLAGFREDRRNMSKPVKPLYYGAFSSYAPSYDSTFANLTKEESELVYHTYGDEASVQYADSITSFAENSDYTATIVDDLLDILTSGDHKKTKKFLEERRKLREEDEKIKHLLEKPSQDVQKNMQNLEKVKVDIDQLKSLTELGIDVNFLEKFEDEIKKTNEQVAIQTRLDETANILSNLRQTQQERLSAPPPAHLSNVPKAQESEILLAEKITENLTEIAKKLPPSAIAPVDGLRRAMGIAPVGGGPVPMDVEPITHNPAIIMDNAIIQHDDANRATESVLCSINPQGPNLGLVNEVQIQIPITEPSVVPDLESELREFLENDSIVGHSPLHDDKTLEDILSES